MIALFEVDFISIINFLYIFCRARISTLKLFDLLLPIQCRFTWKSFFKALSNISLLYILFTALYSFFYTNFFFIFLFVSIYREGKEETVFLVYLLLLFSKQSSIFFFNFKYQHSTQLYKLTRFLIIILHDLFI